MSTAGHFCGQTQPHAAHSWQTPPDIVALLLIWANVVTPRTHALPVNGYCPRCRIHEWDTAARPLTERVTGYAPNATCPKVGAE